MFDYNEAHNRSYLGNNNYSVDVRRKQLLFKGHWVEFISFLKKGVLLFKEWLAEADNGLLNQLIEMRIRMYELRKILTHETLLASDNAFKQTFFDQYHRYVCQHY